jgi:PhnB protein
MDTPDLPPQWKNKVMHATLEADGKHLMASDRVPSQPFKGYSGISISINIPKDATRGKKVFDALAQGGRIEMPFQKTFWGAQFGMLTDRFGVPWMVNCDE